MSTLALLVGCGTSGGGPRPQTRDGGGGAPSAPCPTLNQTAPCMCGTARGRRVCGEDGWNECECEGVVRGDGGIIITSPIGTPPGNLRSDITFDWDRSTQNPGASCEPGRYEGDFNGFYASQLTYVGVPIPVFSLGNGITPGLSFTLAQSANGETLDVRDGMMVGTANGLFPFNGVITGTLDCTTLRFDAILDGYYSLGVDGVGMFRFRGPIVGDYDPVAHTIINATWDVMEYDPPSMAPNVGGEGMWDATWVGP